MAGRDKGTSSATPPRYSTNRHLTHRFFGIIPMNPPLPDLGLYCSLMEEIKLRMECIEGICLQSENIPGKVALEFSFLQLRMIYEIITLACLVAHGDDTTRIMHKFGKKWHAGEIANELPRLNFRFFQVPVNFKILGGLSHIVTDVEPNPMTKREFQAFYRHCGEQLHRGTLSRLLHTTPLTDISLDPVLASMRRICSLMNMHRIASADASKQIICAMTTGPDKKAAAITAVRPPLSHPRPTP